MGERESRVVLSLEKTYPSLSTEKNPAVPFRTRARIFTEKWDKNQPAITDFFAKKTNK